MPFVTCCVVAVHVVQHHKRRLVFDMGAAAYCSNEVIDLLP